MFCTVVHQKAALHALDELALHNHYAHGILAGCRTNCPLAVAGHGQRIALALHCVQRGWYSGLAGASKAAWRTATKSRLAGNAHWQCCAQPGQCTRPLPKSAARADGRPATVDSWRTVRVLGCTTTRSIVPSVPCALREIHSRLPSRCWCEASQGLVVGLSSGVECHLLKHLEALVPPSR